MPPCSALLHFNKSFSLHKSASDSQTSYPKTSSWRADKHCCNWDGVKCDKNTSHVVGLDLSSSWLMGHYHSNNTLFFLPNLRKLNLADNWFNRSLSPSEFGNFKSLTHLNLSLSVFAGQIPFEISQLSSLVSLDLNGLLLIKAPVWKRVIGNLTQLRELILDRTNMSSIRPNSLMNLSSSLTTLSLCECDLQGKLKNNILFLPNIQTLDLAANSDLEVSLPKSNWSCNSQKFLDLSSTNFLGELPSSIGNLKSLEHLDLSSINFSGELPSSIGNLKSLDHLDLSWTNFSGELPSPIGNLKSLEHLDLSSTNFSGELPSSIGNLKSLEYLDLSSTNFSGELPSSIGNLKSLEYLDLSSPNFLGELPSSIGNLKSLEHLDFSYCNFSGSIPAWLGNLTKLIYLDLSSNSFSGLLPSSLFNLSNLSTLHLSYNQLVGPLPSHLIVIVGVGVSIRPKISSTLDGRY
ncbi:receptor-like protein 9DC3 isoform X2 [Quercus lobata]|uniref:receptor-like protein 9DC3 isoform X2 n=1 Tax=Quercus lobata TaxID=97700 RepID=UPI001245D81D|nr:receptor-like protein 9DC3 isoform X2 [Quercus lobata]